MELEDQFSLPLSMDQDFSNSSQTKYPVGSFILPVPVPKRSLLIFATEKEKEKEKGSIRNSSNNNSSSDDSSIKREVRLDFSTKERSLIVCTFKVRRIFLINIDTMKQKDINALSFVFSLFFFLF